MKNNRTLLENDKLIDQLYYGFQFVLWLVVVVGFVLWCFTADAAADTTCDPSHRNCSSDASYRYGKLNISTPLLPTPPPNPNSMFFPGEDTNTKVGLDITTAPTSKSSTLSVVSAAEESCTIALDEPIKIDWGCINRLADSYPTNPNMYLAFLLRAVHEGRTLPVDPVTPPRQDKFNCTGCLRR